MRQKRLHLGLLLLTLAVCQIASNPIKDGTKCATQCSAEESNFYYKFAPGEYTYDYENSVKMNTESRTAELVLSAKAKVSYHGMCEFSMQLENVKMTEKVTDGGKTVDKDLTTNAAALTKNAVRFAIDAGKVTSFCPDKSETTFAANVKRAIISQFQVTRQQHDNFQAIEDDVNGRCQVLYDFKKSESGGFLVNKTKLIEGCLRKTHLVTDIKGYKSEYPTVFGQTPILKGQHKCQLEIGESGDLLSSKCTESHAAKAVMARTESVRTEIVQTLKKVSQKTAPAAVTIDAIQHQLTFQHADHTVTDNKEDKSLASTIIDDICKNGLDIAKQAQQFRNLIRSLRSFTDADLNAFSSSLEKGKCGKQDLDKVALDFYHDALPSVRTEPAILLMINELKDDHLSESSQKIWLRILSRVVPTTKILEASKSLLTQPKSFLAVSSLINTFCLKNSKCGDDKVVKDLTTVIVEKLGADCSYTTENKETIGLALRATGNVGATNLESIWNVLGKCIQNPSISTEFKVSALQAYRRLPCEDRILDVFELYKDATIDPELRITAFQTLIRCHSKPKVIQQVIEVFNKEESLQVGSYVFSYFDSILKSFSPTKSLFKEKIKFLMKDEEEASKKFTLEFFKYSRYLKYYKELPSLRSVAIVQSSIIYSPDAFFPKSTSFNFTLDISGNKVNFLDVGMRFKNFDAWVNRMQDINPFGNKMSMQSVHDQWKTGNKKAFDLSEIKPKTEPKPEESAKVGYYIRVFGDEIAYKDDIDVQECLNLFLVGQPDRSSPKVSKEMNRNLMLTDGMITIPTMAGYSLQLHLETVVSSNSKLSFDFEAGKKLELELRPRVAAYVVGRLTLDSGVSKMHTVLEASTYTKVGGKIQIVKDSNGVSFSAAPTDPKAELINLNTNVYLETDDTPKLVSPVAPSGLEYTKFNNCWSDNMFKVMGRKLCLNYELPKVNSGDEYTSILLSPFFRGNTKFNLYWDGDPKLKSYEIKVTCPNCFSGDLTNWKTDVEREFLFDTPGTDVNRKINLKYSRKVTKTSEDAFDINSELKLITPWRSLESKVQYKSTSADDKTLTATMVYTGTKDIKVTMNWDMTQGKGSRKHNMKLVSGKYGEIGSGMIDVQLKDGSEGVPSTSKSNIKLTFNKYTLTWEGQRQWLIQEIVPKDSNDYEHTKKFYSLKLNTKITDPSDKSLFAYTHDSSFNRTVVNLAQKDVQKESSLRLCHTITSESVPEFLNIDCKLPMIIEGKRTRTTDQVQSMMLSVIIPSKGYEPQDSRLFFKTAVQRGQTLKDCALSSTFMLPFAEVGSDFTGKFKSKKEFLFSGMLKTAKDKTHSWIATANLTNPSINYVDFSFKTCSNKMYGFSVNTSVDSTGPGSAQVQVTTKIMKGESQYNHTLVVTMSGVQHNKDILMTYKAKYICYQNESLTYNASAVLSHVGKRLVSFQAELQNSIQTIYVHDIGYEVVWEDTEAALRGKLHLNLPRRNFILKTNLNATAVRQQSSRILTTDYLLLIDYPETISINTSLEHTTSYTKGSDDKLQDMNSFVNLKTGNEYLDTMFKMKITSTPSGDETKTIKGEMNWQNKATDSAKSEFTCEIDKKDKVSVKCKEKTEVGSTNPKMYNAEYSFIYVKSKSLKFDSVTKGSADVSINGDFDFSQEMKLTAKLMLQTGFEAFKKASFDLSIDIADPKNSKIDTAMAFNDYKGEGHFSSVTNTDKEYKLKLNVGKETTIFLIDHTVTVSETTISANNKWVYWGDEATLKALIPRKIETGKYNPEITISNKIKSPFDFVLKYNSAEKTLTHQFFIKNLNGNEFKLDISQTGILWSGPANLNAEANINTFTLKGLYVTNGEYNDKLDAQLNLMRMKDGKQLSNFDLKISAKKINLVLEFYDKKFEGLADFATNTDGLITTVKVSNKDSKSTGSLDINYQFKKSLVVKASLPDPAVKYDISLIKADNNEEISPLNWKLSVNIDQSSPKKLKGSTEIVVNCNIKDGVGKAEISADMNYKVDDDEEKSLKFELNGQRKPSNLQFKGKVKYNKDEYKFSHSHSVEITENPLPNIDAKSSLETPNSKDYKVAVKYTFKKLIKLEIETPKENFKQVSFELNREEKLFEFDVDIMKKRVGIKADIIRWVEDRQQPFEIKLSLPWGEKAVTMKLEKTSSPGTRLYKFKIECDKKNIEGHLNLTYNFTQLFSSAPVLLIISFEAVSDFDLQKINFDLHHERTGLTYLFEKQKLSYSYKKRRYDLWKAQMTFKNDDYKVFSIDIKADEPKNVKLNGVYDRSLKWLQLSGTDKKNSIVINCDREFGKGAKPCHIEAETKYRKIVLRREVLSDGKMSTKIAWNDLKNHFIQVIRKFDWSVNPVHNGKIYFQLINPLRNITTDFELQRCRIHGDGAQIRLYLESPPNKENNQTLELLAHPCLKEGDKSTPSVTLKSTVFKNIDAMKISAVIEKTKDLTKIDGKLVAKKGNNEDSLVNVAYTRTKNFDTGVRNAKLDVTFMSGWKLAQTLDYVKTTDRFEANFTSKCPQSEYQFNLRRVPGFIYLSDNRGHVFEAQKRYSKIEILLSKEGFGEFLLNQDITAQWFNFYSSVNFTLRDLKLIWEGSNLKTEGHAYFKSYWLKGDSKEPQFVINYDKFYNRYTSIMNLDVKYNQTSRAEFWRLHAEKDQVVNDYKDEKKKAIRAKVKEVLAEFKKSIEKYLDTSAAVHEGTFIGELKKVPGEISKAYNENQFYIKDIMSRYSDALKDGPKNITEYISVFSEKIKQKMADMKQRMRERSQKFVETMTETWKNMKDEIKTAWTRVQDRVSSFRDSIKSVCEKLREIRDKVFTKEDIERWTSAYEALPIRNLMLDMREYRQQVMQMFADIRGSQSTYENMKNIMSNLTSMNFKKAFELYFKPEHYAVEMNRETKSMSMKMYVTPVMKRAKYIAKTVVSALWKMKQSNRMKLVLRTMKKVQYYWKYSNSKLDFVKKLLPPYSTAGYIVSNQNLLQYTGEPVFISPSCYHVLAHEETTGQFSVIALAGAEDSATKEFSSSILIQASTKNKDKTVNIHISPDGTVSLEGENSALRATNTLSLFTFKLTNGQFVSAGDPLTLNSYAETEINYANNIIKKTGEMIKIIMCKSFGGLVIKFFPKSGTGVVIVNGKYFSKVSGLFGRNNYESNSFNTPVVKTENSAKSNLSHWATPKCLAYTAPPKVELNSLKVESCKNAIVMWKNNFCEYSSASVSYKNFQTMCEVPNPNSCSIFTGYKVACDMQGAYTTMPPYEPCVKPY